MLKMILVCLVAFLYPTSAMSERPEWAGKGKPTEEQRAAKKSVMNAKEEIEKEDKELEEHRYKKEKKHKEEGEKPKGLEKQYEKKSSQDQKEIGKGSERGQEASSAKKKWWKFWE